MSTFWAALILVGCALILLSFNLIFRKGKGFPDGEIGRNKELRKRGIICAKEEEKRIWKENSCSDCEVECSLRGIKKEIK